MPQQETVSIDMVELAKQQIIKGALPQPPRRAMPRESGVPAPGSTPSNPVIEPAAPQAAKPPPISEEKPKLTEEHVHDPKQRCKHCGWHPDADPIEPSRDDLFAFMKSVCEGTTFTKSYDLFGNAITVECCVLTPDEEEAARIAALMESAKFGGDERMVRAQTVAYHDDVMIGLTAAKIRIGNTLYERPVIEPYKTQLIETSRGVRGLFKTATPYLAVRRVCLDFTSMIRTIESRALEQSFSPATALAGTTSETGSPDKS